jgi:hypothetical protein
VERARWFRSQRDCSGGPKGKERNLPSPMGMDGVRIARIASFLSLVGAQSLDPVKAVPKPRGLRDFSVKR